MPLPFQAGETIILRRVRPLVLGGVRQTDDFGVLVMTTADEFVSGAAIWPSSNSEVTQGGDRSRSAYYVALPQETVADAIDRIVWRGLEYEIEGEPELFQSPFTGTSLQQITIVRVEG